MALSPAEHALEERLTQTAEKTGATVPVDLDRLTFAPGEAKLNEAGTQQLSQVAQLLRTHPNHRLVVLGYAALTEPKAFTLALDRANAAVRELTRLGIPAASLQGQGRLASNADNPTPEYKRRITLYVSALN